MQSWSAGNQFKYLTLFTEKLYFWYTKKVKSSLFGGDEKEVSRENSKLLSQVDNVVLKKASDESSNDRQETNNIDDKQKEATPDVQSEMNSRKAKKKVHKVKYDLDLDNRVDMFALNRPRR